jgi:hypothetical protein
MGDYIGAKSTIGTDKTYYYLLFWLIFVDLPLFFSLKGIWIA